MTTFRVTADQLAQIERTLRQPAPAGAAHGDPGAVAGRIRAHFLLACQTAGLPGTATTADLMIEVSRGLEAAGRSAFPFLDSYLRLLTNPLFTLAQYPDPRAPFAVGWPNFPGATPTAVSAAGAGGSPPLPSYPSGDTYPAPPPPRRSALRAIGFVAAAAAVVWLGVVGYDKWTEQSRRDDIEKAQPVVAATAEYLRPVADNRLDQAMKAVGFTHHGVTDAEWATFAAPRRADLYYRAAETHAPGSGGRALARLSHELTRARYDAPSDLTAFARRESDRVEFRPITGGDRTVPPTWAPAAEVLADVLSRTAAVDAGGEYFRSVGYSHPGISDVVWNALPAAERLGCLYSSAEAHSSGSGGRALALLSRVMAQQYESVRLAEAVRPLLDLAARPEPVQFAAVPHPAAAQAAPLPEPYRAVMRSLAEYVEGGGFGARAVLVDRFLIPRDRAFELLRTGTVAEALTRGLAESPVGDITATVDGLVRDVTRQYESARSNQVIRRYQSEHPAAGVPESRPAERSAYEYRPGERAYIPPVRYTPPPRTYTPPRARGR